MQYIVGYQHYGIFCTDVVEASGIYQRAFGFTEKSCVEIGKGEGYWKIVILDCGTVTLELLQHGDLSQIRPSAVANQNHIGLRVKDLDGLLTELLCNFKKEFKLEPGGYVLDVVDGVPVFPDKANGFTGAHTYPDMKWQYLRGPNGERIELIEALC